MIITRAQQRKQLQEGLNTVFGMEYKKYKDQYTEVFDMETSKKAYEEDVLNVGFGGAVIKPEGAGVNFDTGGESYVSRYNHSTVALAFALTQEAEEDNLYGALGKRYSKALARSMKFTKETIAFNVLNNGFDSNFTGGDGVELFSLLHPTAGGVNAQNELTTPADLSESALEDALIEIADFTDDKQLKIAVKGRKLIVPTALMFTARRILGSSFRPGTADNDINVINQDDYFGDGICVSNYLTDADAWFIKTDVSDGLKWFNRVGIQRGLEGDFETGNLRYKSRERYSFGFSDFRGAFASAGA